MEVKKEALFNPFFDKKFRKSKSVTQNTKPVLIILFLPLSIAKVLVLCKFGKPDKKSSTYSEIPQHH